MSTGISLSTSTTTTNTADTECIFTTAEMQQILNGGEAVISLDDGTKTITIKVAPVEAKLTPVERHFCELFSTGYIARDKSYNGLHLYIDKPTLPDGSEVWVSNVDDGKTSISLKVLSEFTTKPLNFSFITWESGKAWSIEELLTLEVEE